MSSQQDNLEHETLRLALTHCERRYAELLNAVTDYTYTVTIENDLAVKTTHSPACIGVTGYSSDEYDSRPYLWLDMIHADDRDFILKQTAEILAGQGSSVIEHRIYHKDGSIRWVQNTIVKRYNVDDRLYAYDGLVRDITIRKAAEEEREQLINELQKAISEIKTLRGIIPICAYCKKIRNDKGVWDRLEAYISRHSDAQFSHGACPECYFKQMADLEEED